MATEKIELTLDFCSIDPAIVETPWQHISCTSKLIFIEDHQWRALPAQRAANDDGGPTVSSPSCHCRENQNNARLSPSGSNRVIRLSTRTFTNFTRQANRKPGGLTVLPRCHCLVENQDKATLVSDSPQLATNLTRKQAQSQIWPKKMLAKWSSTCH